MQARIRYIKSLSLTLLGLFMLLMQACDDVPTDDGGIIVADIDNILVVEAIMDAHQPVDFVNLQWFKPLSEELIPATELFVLIEDEEGNQIILEEKTDAPGVYTDRQGTIIQPGEEYFLTIRSDSSEHFASTIVPDDIEIELSEEAFLFLTDTTSRPVDAPSDSIIAVFPTEMIASWEDDVNDGLTYYQVSLEAIEVDSSRNFSYPLTDFEKAQLGNYEEALQDNFALLYPGQFEHFGVYALVVTAARQELLDIIADSEQNLVLSPGVELPGNIENGTGIFTALNFGGAAIFVVPFQ